MTQDEFVFNLGFLDFLLWLLEFLKRRDLIAIMRNMFQNNWRNSGNTMGFLFISYSWYIFSDFNFAIYEQ